MDMKQSHSAMLWLFLRWWLVNHILIRNFEFLSSRKVSHTGLQTCLQPTSALVDLMATPPQHFDLMWSST